MCSVHLNKLLLVLDTWRRLQTIQFTDQPVKVITEQGTVCTISSDQRSFTKESKNTVNTLY